MKKRIGRSFEKAAKKVAKKYANKYLDKYTGGEIKADDLGL